MKIIKITTRLDRDWSGKFVDENSYDLLLNEDADVYKPDGKLLCSLRKRIVPTEELSRAWSVLRAYNPMTDNRGVAAGTGYVQRIKQDGTLSKKHGTPPEGIVSSGIIGYFERSVRYPYCRACAWNLQNPESWASLLPMIQAVSRIFEREAPESYAFQNEVVKQANPDFVIPGTVFTTLTVNKNFRTAAHKDAGDLPGGASCMSVIREGKYHGANLCFPDFRVAVQLDTADLIIFDPHEFHGNTKLVPLSEKSTRCSIVYYFREGVKHCGSASEEFDRVKNRKLGDHLV